MALIFNRNAPSLVTLGGHIGLKWAIFFNLMRSRELPRLFWLFLSFATFWPFLGHTLTPKNHGIEDICPFIGGNERILENR